MQHGFDSHALVNDKGAVYADEVMYVCTPHAPTLPGMSDASVRSSLARGFKIFLP
jgi:hypothetical protein